MPNTRAADPRSQYATALEEVSGKRGSGCAALPACDGSESARLDSDDDGRDGRREVKN